MNGKWSTWTPWSECSVSCGNGTRHSSRICYSPVNGGADCVGDKMQTENCSNGIVCPGQFSWDLNYFLVISAHVLFT